MLEITSNEDRRLLSDVDRLSAPVDEVLHSFTRQYAGPGRVLSEFWPDAVKAIQENVIEVDSAEFQGVAEATYHEVLGHPDYEDIFRTKFGSLRNLPGIKPNEVRFLIPNMIRDDIDVMLHLAQFNFESYLADRVGAHDQTAGPGATPIVAARARRAIRTRELSEAFRTILDLRRVPDLSSLHCDDEASKKLWKFRDSRENLEFRRWFHDNIREKPDEAGALFVDTLERAGIGDHRAVRPLRYLTFNVAPEVAGSGFIPGFPQIPDLGLFAGAADSLLFGRLLQPRGPKLMVDKLRGILPDLRVQQDRTHEPNVKGGAQRGA
jgi:hypothetical protein